MFYKFLKIANSKHATFILTFFLIGSIAVTLLVYQNQNTIQADTPINILYLIPEDHEKIENQLAPQTLMSQGVSLTLAEDWHMVNEEVSRQSVQALIIHHEALALVNDEEIKHFFTRENLVVVGLGIPGDELAELLGVPHLYSQTWPEGHGYRTPVYFYAYSYRIEGSSDDIAHIEAAKGKVSSHVQHPASLNTSAATDSLLVEGGIENMFRIIKRCGQPLSACIQNNKRG